MYRLTCGGPVADKRAGVRCMRHRLQSICANGVDRCAGLWRMRPSAAEHSRESEQRYDMLRNDETQFEISLVKARLHESAWREVRAPQEVEKMILTIMFVWPHMPKVAFHLVSTHTENKTRSPRGLSSSWTNGGKPMADDHAFGGGIRKFGLDMNAKPRRSFAHLSDRAR